MTTNDGVVSTECIESKHYLKLLPKQRAFVKSGSNRRAFIGGWGTGKTTTAAWMAVYLACNYPGSRGMVAGVSYIRHIKDKLKPDLVNFIPGSLRIHNTERMTTIHFDNVKINGQILTGVESKILYYGIGRVGDENAFRSEQFDWAIIDEATSCNEQAFKFVASRLGRRSNTNILAVSTTPDAPGHWLKQYLDDNDFEVITMKTEDNTHLPQDYLLGMRKAYPGAFGLRYLEALWVNVESAMFSLSDYRICEAPDERMTIVAACDPASSKNGDYFVIAVLGKTVNSPAIYLLELICERGIPITRQVECLKRIQSKWNPIRFIVETTGYQESLRQLAMPDIPHLQGIKPVTDKVFRAQSLSACWQNGNFYFSDDIPEGLLKQARNQFLGFPEGEHDDIVDACAYAYNSLAKRIPPNLQVSGFPRY